MLSREVFKKEVTKLVVEHSDRGFTMGKEKAEQWYEHMKCYSEEVFQKGIAGTLLSCNKAPTMADVIRCLDEARAQRRYPLIQAPEDFNP